jgi:hypothetical protein
MDRDRVKQVIIEETIPKIVLGEDNEPVLNILESTIGVDTAPVKEVLADFEDRLGKEKDACEEKLRTRLVEKGISGSAAIPNIAADPEWARSVAQLEGVLKEKLNSLTLKD